MSNLALITARGGSKRLPGKNIRHLGGKPLIAWTIEAAIKSECFSHVIVSTDDAVIAEISRSYGALVPFVRPEYLSSDNATSDAVISHAVMWLEENSNIKFSAITLLQPTSPFRNSSHIRECMSLFQRNDADAVVSVSPVDIKLELCNELPSDGSLRNFINTKETRTQDMKNIFMLNGSMYMFKKSLVGSLARIYEVNAKSFAYIMSPLDSVDIDTELDFKWAEFLLAQR